MDLNDEYVKEKVWRVSLLGAGFCSTFMSAYHYWLPFQFGWTRDIKPNAPNVAWGALMVNFCFSTLLLLGGVITFLCAIRWKQRDQLTTLCVMSMALFWIANMTYQLVIPMPLPPQLSWLRWILVSYAGLALTLYSTALLAARSATVI